MQRLRILKHEFVEFIPDNLKDGTIYISTAFATAAHKCCCGCGKEVITPLSPTDWELTFDGESISIKPSIGNWNFACQSHYWIKHNSVEWAPRWSQKKIKSGRADDRLAKEKYFNNAKTPAINDTNATAGRAGKGKSVKSKPKKKHWRWFA
jgi:hypothetical protein